MMKSIFLFTCLLVGATFTSCNSDGSSSDSNSIGDKLKVVKAIEDSLMEASKSGNNNATDFIAMQDRYIAQLLEVYKEYPKEEKSAACLDKAHMVYSGMGDYLASSKWADTLLQNFPKYVNRALILESQATTFDALLIPRDSSKVRKYYTQLLTEFPNLDKSKREDISNRLKFNKLTFDQYIEIQIAEDIDAM